MNKKIIFVMMLTFLLIAIPSIAAYDKAFSPISNQVSFNDAGKEIAKVKLVNYSRYCFVGECYMYLQINLTKDDLATLQDYKYYDALQTKELSVSRTKTFEFYNPDYTWNETFTEDKCIGNSTPCPETKIITMNGRWETYDVRTLLKSGNYLFRLKVEVGKGETIDVVPILFGTEIKEWADFTGMTKYEWQPSADNSEWAYSGYVSYQSFGIGYNGTNITQIVGGVSISFQEINVAASGTVYYFIYNATAINECNENQTVAKGELAISEDNLNHWINITGTTNGTLKKGGMYCLQINSTYSNQAYWKSYRAGSVYAGGQIFNQDDGWRIGDATFEIWGDEAGSFSVVLGSPNGTGTSISSTQSFDVNSSTGVIEGEYLNNITYHIWNNTGLHYNITYVISGTSNVTNRNITGFHLEQNYSWNALVCRNSSTKTTCQWAGSNNTFFYSNYAFAFGLCNTTLTTPYWNITFQNEKTAVRINASISSSTYYYWETSATYNRTFTLTNNTENMEYAFCSDGRYNKTLSVIPIIYYASTGYPQRTYSPGTKTFNSTTTNSVLKLLATADGIYSTFQFINSALQNLVSVKFNATTGGSEVCSGYSDAAGSITCFLNPDTSHTLYATKSGYSDYTSSIFPTQTSYTISMTSTSSSSNLTECNRGINILFYPQGNYLFNATYYIFNMSMVSSYWTLDSFGFNITDNLGNLIITQSLASTDSGSVAVNLSTWQNTTLNVTYFFDASSPLCNTTQSHLTYTIWDGSDTGWSIKNFITNLSSYLDSGIFGLKKGFGLNIILFFVVLFVTGIVSYKFGLYNPAVIALVAASMVAFVDAGLGLIYGMEQGIATVFMLLITLGLLIREATSY